MAVSEKRVIIYTDGACSGNPGPGGWGAVMLYGKHRKELNGYEPETTNNRMELRAVIEAVTILKRASQIDLYTDSTYVMKGVTEWMPRWIENGWKTASRKPVKNQDLWQQLASALERHETRWHWVKGHSGNELNDCADSLARDAILTAS